MSIVFQVLGEPGRDNALWVRIDTGQSRIRLLFDCGEGCASTLPVSEILAFDHLFFSHLHMDHVGGFDSFFRCTYRRESRPNEIWGPPGTARILQHRFQGFLWNLQAGLRGTWYVNDIHPDHVERTRYETSEAFSKAHGVGSTPRSGNILDEPGYTVEAHFLDHGTPSLAYTLREKPRLNIDREKLEGMGLQPGPWLNRLKEVASPGPGTLEIDGRTFPVSKLREDLLVETPGSSLAYLTDFLLDPPASRYLEGVLRGFSTVICEAQYSHADLDLASKNFHLTSRQAAELAARAEVERLVLFHLSERYEPAAWLDMLEEARALFPGAEYPEHWIITAEP